MTAPAPSPFSSQGLGACPAGRPRLGLLPQEHRRRSVAAQGRMSQVESAAAWQDGWTGCPGSWGPLSPPQRHLLPDIASRGQGGVGALGSLSHPFPPLGLDSLRVNILAPRTLLYVERLLVQRKEGTGPALGLTVWRGLKPLISWLPSTGGHSKPDQDLRAGGQQASPALA